MKKDSNKLSRYAGQWVAIQDQKVIAHGQTLESISEKVTLKGKTISQNLPKNHVASALKVPKKSEKPQII